MLAQALDYLQTWITLVIETIGYPGIVLVMVLENLFPPIPSELVMPFAGFLVAQGRFNIGLTILAGTLGSVIGAIALYSIGMWAGEPLVRPFIRRYGRWFLLSEADLDRTLATFSRHGDLIVLGGRVIPIVRSLISLPAGMNRMPLGRFVLFTTIGSLIWTSILTIGGMILGFAWEQMIHLVEVYQDVVLVVLAISAIMFIGARVRGLIERQRRAL